MKSQPFVPLDPALYREVVRRALAEDLGWGDVTTEATVAADLMARGTLSAGAPCVIAGLDVAEEVFRQLDPGAVVTRQRHDGEACGPGDVVAVVDGRAAWLLTAERTALNFLQRLSGIATLTRRFVDLAAGRLVVLDTRQTTPTLRVLEKYAVRAGGGLNHRASLDDGVLIKANHVRLAGGVRAALERTRTLGQEMPVEIEVRTPEEAEEAMAAGTTRLRVLDRPDDVLAEIIRVARGRAQVEVSGDVSPERLPAIAASGADFVSIGLLTHSAPAVPLDFVLEPMP